VLDMSGHLEVDGIKKSLVSFVEEENDDGDVDQVRELAVETMQIILEPEELEQTLFKSQQSLLAVQTEPDVAQTAADIVLEDLEDNENDSGLKGIFLIGVEDDKTLSVDLMIQDE